MCCVGCLNKLTIRLADGKSILEKDSDYAKIRKLIHINDGIMGIKTIKALNLEEKNNTDEDAINGYSFEYLKNNCAYGCKYFVLEKI